jgi:hypothetical protein
MGFFLHWELVQYTQEIPSAKKTIEKAAINKTKSGPRRVKCIYIYIYIYIDI